MKRLVIDIAQLNMAINANVSRIDALRKDINAIVAEIEGKP